MNRLDRWLWGGSLPGGTGLLPVPEELCSPGDGKDFLGHCTALLETVERLEERLRQRQPERNASGVESEAEMRQLAKAMLPALDALDRLMGFADDAVLHKPELDPWRTALQGIRVRLLKSLEKIGLTPMSCVGMKLDLNLHDVVKTVKVPGTDPETILEEPIKGYYFRGKLLRDAKVVVAT